MRVPKGKILFARATNREVYPDTGGDPIEYALSLDCDGVCLFSTRTAPSIMSKARGERRIDISVYTHGPADTWLPDTWRSDLSELLEGARAAGTREIVVNPENAPRWHGHEREADAFGDALAQLRREGYSVGLVSFPSWPFAERIARRSGCFLSCELYDVAHGLDAIGAEGRRAYMRRWDRFGGAGHLPALAMWGRDGNGQARYQATFPRLRRGYYLWHAVPAPRVGGPVHSAVKNWRPGSSSAVPILAAGVVAVGAGMLLLSGGTA